MDPYLILNLNEDADDDAVRTAYLNAISLYPPEKNPPMFEMIRSAYEQLITERTRLNYHLFHTKPADPMTIIYSCLSSEAPKTVSDTVSRQILIDGALSLIKKKMNNL